MQKRPSLPAHPATRDELTEILRQSLAGLLPGDPLSHFLDRLEGRR